MYQKTVFGIASVFFLGIGLALAQDKAGVEKMNEEYRAAIENGDVDTMVSLHTEDAVRARTGSPVAVGHAKIRSAITEQFKDRDPNYLISVTIHDIKFLSQDVAIVHGGFKAQIGTGHFIRTVVKKGNSWKIAAIQIARDLD